MLTTYNEMRHEIEDLREEANPEDRLHEIADSLVPIYYGDIIEEWQEMPMEYSNNWQDSITPTADTTITQLMQIDLYNYYYEKLAEILSEAKDEWQEEEEE
jgi:hypothetical protein